MTLLYSYSFKSNHWEILMFLGPLAFFLDLLQLLSKFTDFPGPEKYLFKFPDFPRFPWPTRTYISDQSQDNCMFFFKEEQLEFSLWERPKGNNKLKWRTKVEKDIIKVRRKNLSRLFKLVSYKTKAYINQGVIMVPALWAQPKGGVQQNDGPL